jgi:hypothetical protein
MAKSTGLILAVGTITFGNEWIQTSKPNWKVPIATLTAAAIFAGIEKLSEPLAVGVATIAMITVILGGVTPGVKSPAQEILNSLGYK